MKTLLVNPLFLDGEARLERNVEWLEFVDTNLTGHLNFEMILYIDNSSDETLLDIFSHAQRQASFYTYIERHSKRLLRNTQHSYGYYYYALGRGVKYAIKNGYDKILHIDTDVFLLNKEICTFINELDSGWSSFHCPYYDFAENMLQIICKDQLENALEFYTRDFLSFYPEGTAEKETPFTAIHKDWVVDRYGERNLPQTPDMDAYSQKPNSIKLVFNDNDT